MLEQPPRVTKKGKTVILFKLYSKYSVVNAAKRDLTGKVVLKVPPPPLPLGGDAVRPLVAMYEGKECAECPSKLNQRLVGFPMT